MTTLGQITLIAFCVVWIGLFIAFWWPYWKRWLAEHRKESGDG